jgi:hypothetical protein
MTRACHAGNRFRFAPFSLCRDAYRGPGPQATTRRKRADEHHHDSADYLQVPRLRAARRPSGAGPVGRRSTAPGAATPRVSAWRERRRLAAEQADTTISPAEDGSPLTMAKMTGAELLRLLRPRPTGSPRWGRTSRSAARTPPPDTGHCPVARHREEGGSHVNCDRAIARQRWKRRRPAIYAAIGDPGTYFTKLSEQAGNTCWITLPASAPAFPDPRRPDRIAADSWRRPRNVEAVFDQPSPRM